MVFRILQKTVNTSYTYYWLGMGEEMVIQKFSMSTTPGERLVDVGYFLVVSTLYQTDRTSVCSPVEQTEKMIKTSNTMYDPGILEIRSSARIYGVTDLWYCYEYAKNGFSKRNYYTKTEVKSREKTIGLETIVIKRKNERTSCLLTALIIMGSTRYHCV